MLAEQTTDPPLDSLEAVATREDVLHAIQAAPGRVRGGERQPLRRDPAASYAIESPGRARREPACRDRAPPHGEGTRRSRTAVTTCCRRTSARSLARCSGIGSSSPPRRAPGASRATRSSRRQSKKRPPRREAAVRLGGALLLGLAVTAAALAFGSRSLGIVGVGLLLAASAARIWAGLASGRASVSFSATPAPAVEGDRVVLRVAADRSSGVPVGSIVASGVLGRLGPFETRLRGHGRHARGELDAGPAAARALSGVECRSDARRPPRARVAGDAGGERGIRSRRAASARRRRAPLQRRGPSRRVWAPAAPPPAGRVRPAFGARVHPGRVPAPRALADDRPDRAADGEGARGLTARRGRRPPRLRSRGLRGCELRHELRRGGASCRLRAPPLRRAESQGDPRDDRSRLRRPAGELPRRRLPSRTGGALRGRAGRALLSASRGCGRDGCARHPAGELVVVTSNLDPAAMDAIHAVSLGRLVSVVWVDAPSYVGRPTAAATGPLRLMRLGIPVAVVRRGEPLAARSRPRGRRDRGRMARALAACILPALAIAVAWLRVEEPARVGEAIGSRGARARPGARPRMAGSGRLRASRRWPGSHGSRSGPSRGSSCRSATSGSSSRSLNAIGDGVAGFYTTVLPFETPQSPEMHGLVLSAVFGFVLATSLLAAAGRPFSAVAVAVVGVCWPATLMGGQAVLLGSSRSPPRSPSRSSCVRGRGRPSSQEWPQPRWSSPERRGRLPRRTSLARRLSTGKPGTSEVSRRPRRRASVSCGMRTTTASSSRRRRPSS